MIVPTIELLRQWRTGLVETAGVPADQVGMVGGGERTVKPVTVMRVLQTVGGRMIFAQPKGELAEPRRPRAIDR